MPRISKKGYDVKAIFSLLIPIFFVVLKPLSMTASQSMVLGSLFLTIAWWVTGWIYKDYASFFLLGVFIIFGHTPLESIFTFPLSDNFILIIASYLLSQGIINSKIADVFSDFVLSRYCDTAKKLVVMSFAMGILLIFVIPQSFPRVILLASIYLNFLNREEVDDETRKVLFFSVFVASSVTSMMFLKGDVIINYAVMRLSGLVFTDLQWITYMTVPTLITTVIVAAAFIRIFKGSLVARFENIPKEKLSFDKDGKRALVIMAFIILLWLTEACHGVSASNVALLGVACMFAVKVIHLKDMKAVNVSLLIFLTAQFSIGKVLTTSGVATQISHAAARFFPPADSFFYIPFIILLIMTLHAVMGGLVTTVSVAIPLLIPITAGVLEPQFIALLCLVSVCIHYFLPFHHATIMIGYGSGYYENRHTLKFGLALTVITFVVVLGVYMPWWKWVGLI